MSVALISNSSSFVIDPGKGKRKIRQILGKLGISIQLSENEAGPNVFIINEISKPLVVSELGVLLKDLKPVNTSEAMSLGCKLRFRRLPGTLFLLGQSINSA